jgi:hypothetical protein
VKRGGAAPDSNDASGQKAFERVLDEVGRSDDGAQSAAWGGRPLGRSFETFAAPIDSSRDGVAPAESWRRALDWIADSPDLTATDLSDNPDSIAAELDLARVHTREQLKRARRRFMWENHPDRRLDAPRDLANRRVAIANMLLDRAELALRKDGAS